MTKVRREILCRISLYHLTREAWLHGLCQSWNISRWNALDRAMHLYSLYLPHKCFELCGWRSWHQNGWSKKDWVGEMAGNVCVSNAQNLATGKWGESPQCATYHKCTWRGHCTPSNITSAVVSSIQTRQFLLPTLFNLLHVARLITLTDLVCYEYPFSLLFTITITLFSVTVIHCHTLPSVLYKPLLLTCIPQLVL